MSINLVREMEDALADAYLSTLVAAKLFFPERFFRPFAPFHKDICASLDNKKIQQKVWAAPRGTGKTSLVDLAYPAKKILFREKRFIVLVSSSATMAEEQAENLKSELMTNPVIRRLFGSLKSPRWSKEAWIVEWEDGFRTMVLPRGAGQQVRGSLFDNYRPDLIIGDDIEKDDEVLSEEQRKKRREWFFASLCNCVDRGSKEWEIVYIDTVKHQDSLICRLLEDKSWFGGSIRMGDERLNSNWPEFMTTKALISLSDEYRDRGELDLFYMEYMNLPISTEEAGFRQEYYYYFVEGGPELTEAPLEGFVILDPAKTVNPKSANTAIIGGSVQATKERIFFRDLINEKLHPDEMVDKAIKMCEAMGSRILAVEVTSLNEFITFPILNEIRRRGLDIELVELRPRAKKEDRAKALIPLYRRGQVWHNKTAMLPLEQQELSFPKPRLWDCLDAAAYIVELLAAGSRYFNTFGGDYTAEEAEKEFEALEDEYDEDDYDDEGFDWAPGAHLPSYV